MPRTGARGHRPARPRRTGDRGDQLADRFGRGQVEVGGDDPGPVGGEPQRGRPADSAARTGHYDELVPERFLRVAHGPFRVVYSPVIYPVRSARVTVIIDCP